MLMNLLVGLITCRINDRAPDRVRSADLFDAATLGGAVRSAAPTLAISPRARRRILPFSTLMIK